jgi:hypothetical protein
MKTVEDVVRAINNYMLVVLDNPKGFACDPRALEAVLIVLESVKEFAIDNHLKELDPPKSYFAYLENRGHGNATFTRRCYPESVLTDKDLNVFKELSRFWKDYMAERDKVSRPW